MGLDPALIPTPEGKTPALVVVTQLMEHGLLVPPAGPHTIRLLPPLNVTEAEIDEALAILHSVLGLRELDDAIAELTSDARLISPTLPISHLP